MAEAIIPVDLRNPGQVFACLGLVEAAEVLCGPSESGFGYENGETLTTFALRTPDHEDPVEAALCFLAEAEAVALAPAGSSLAAGWNARTEAASPGIFPAPAPEKPATLPMVLRAHGQSLCVEHWLDGDHVGRDNVKFWAGAQGKPGVSFAQDALALFKAAWKSRAPDIVADPFAFDAPMRSSFRFDWRRDYTALGAGFSPNTHKSGSNPVVMVGYPLVELLAAIGLQNARPARIDRRDKLSYRYGVWGARLPAVLARAVLGGQGLGFPARIFRMRLGWPSQEGQARCILDAQEEFA